MRAIFLFTVLITSLGCSPSQQDETGISEPTTFILVRHAEKDSGDDPDLTEEGLQRAERLAEMLGDTKLDAVYSTDTKRTRQTAMPTAEDHALEVGIYDAAELNEWSDRIVRDHAGQTVLIVGHSNTTPELANYLTDTESQISISDSDYGKVLVVTLSEGGGGRVLQLRY